MDDARLAIEELFLDGEISLTPPGRKATAFFNRMKEIADSEKFPWAMEYDKRTGVVKLVRTPDH